MRLHCISALCALLALAGCGQKGPLFLPGDPNEGRIVLPDELAGQEQGEQVERPGDATNDSGAAEDEDGEGAAPDGAAQDDRGGNERRPQPDHEEGNDEQ